MIGSDPCITRPVLTIGYVKAGRSVSFVRRLCSQPGWLQLRVSVRSGWILGIFLYVDVAGFADELHVKMMKRDESRIMKLGPRLL